MSESKSGYEYVYVMVNSDKKPVKGGVIKTEKPLEGGFDDKGVVKEGYGKDVGVIFGKMKDYNKTIVNCGSGDKIVNPDMYCVFLNKGNREVAALGRGKTGEGSRFVDMYVANSIDKGIQVKDPIRLCYGEEVATAPASGLVSDPALTPETKTDVLNVNDLKYDSVFKKDSKEKEVFMEEFIENDCYDNFEVYEAGARGDCFYYVVAAALKTGFYGDDKQKAMMSIRTDTVDMINSSKKNAIKNYFYTANTEVEKIDNMHKEVHNDTEPQEIYKRQRKLKHYINFADLTTQGLNARDPHITMVAIAFKTNIFVFSHQNGLQPYIHSRSSECLLVNNPTGHFQLISYNNKNTISYTDFKHIYNNCLKKEMDIGYIDSIDTIDDLLTDSRDDLDTFMIDVKKVLYDIYRLDKSEAAEYLLVTKKDNENANQFAKRVLDRVQQKRILIDYMETQQLEEGDKKKYKTLMEHIPLEDYNLNTDDKKYIFYSTLKRMHTLETDNDIDMIYIKELIKPLLEQVDKTTFDRIDNELQDKKTLQDRIAQIDEKLYFNAGSRRNRRNDRKQNQKQNQRTRKRKTSLT